MSQLARKFRCDKGRDVYGTRLLRGMSETDTVCAAKIEALRAP